MTEGGIAAWKKQPGESFTAGDVLLEIETDKATMDVEAQDDGILAKIMVGDGNKAIPIGTPIAILAEEGDDLSGADALAEQAANEQPEKAEEKSDDKPAEQPKEESKEESKKESKPSSPPSQPTSTGPAEPRETIAATPIARKLALERGVPLKQLKGTGPEGRITKEDVEKYKGTPAAPAKGGAQPSGQAAAAFEDIPVSNMRKVIGQRLSESKSQTPHYYVTNEVDLTKLLKLRTVFNSAAESEKRAKLSVNDFILKGVAIALKEVPEANQAWLGENIRQYHQADISVAVATPTGLITPIIKNAGGKGLAQISAETKALAVKARDGKLKPEEYQGGTFTISNLGMFGSVSDFTASEFNRYLCSCMKRPY